MIAVAETAEGRGAGAALLRAAEEWTRAQGYGTLTLNVFEGNQRARRAYEREGFCVETLKYVKHLALALFFLLGGVTSAQQPSLFNSTGRLTALDQAPGGNPDCIGSERCVPPPN